MVRDEINHQHGAGKFFSGVCYGLIRESCAFRHLYRNKTFAINIDYFEIGLIKLVNQRIYVSACSSGVIVYGLLPSRLLWRTGAIPRFHLGQTDQG